MVVPVVGNGQRLLEDNFGAYNAGNLEGQSSWAAYGSHTADPIQLVEASLSYPDYQETASGKAAELGTGSVGQDLKKTFSTGPIADLYYSALVSFKETTIDAGKETYFINLIKSGATTEFAKVYAKQGSTSSKIILGLTRNSDSEVVYSDEEIDCNSTHLIVVQYQSVPGATNDQVALYVNPTPEQNTPTVTYSGSTGSDVDNFDEGDGFDAIELRQGATYSKRAANVLVDAIRVSTTWEGLFNGEGGGEEPEPSEEPEITLDKEVVMVQEEGEYNVYIGREYPFTLNLKAANLTEDVTIALEGTSNGQVTTTMNTITKDDAEKGIDIPFTLTPTTTDWAYVSENIIISTDGLEPLTVPVYWQTCNLIEASDIQTLRSERAKLTEDEAYLTAFVITGEVLVSHAYEDNGDKTIYVQDATGGLKIVGSWGSITTDYAVGDKLANILMMTEDAFGVFGVPTKDFGEPLSRGNEVTPATLTLTDLKANGSRYEGCLVKVEDVTFTMRTNETGIVTEGKFGDDGLFVHIKQGNDSASIDDLPGADFIGKAIPESARSIIGISTSASGSAIAPRSLADIDADFDEPGGEDPGTEPEEPGNEVEVGENLLLDPSFENGKEQNFFGQITYVWEDWDELTQGSIEETIVIDGEKAVRMTSKGNANMSQVISYVNHTFTPGTAYRLTLNYHVVKSQGDNDIQLNCGWTSSMSSVEDPNAGVLTTSFTGAPNTWEKKQIRTVVPVGERINFQFGLSVASGAEVIFDNFSLYKLEAITTGLEAASENGLSAWTESGVLYLGSDCAQTVDVYSLNGVLISRTNLTPGVNALALPAGAYVLKADDQVQKVFVK